MTRRVNWDWRPIARMGAAGAVVQPQKTPSILFAKKRENMLQLPPPVLQALLLGRGAMAAQQTLDLFILVRVRTPQPNFLGSVSSESEMLFLT